MGQNHRGFLTVRLMGWVLMKFHKSWTFHWVRSFWRDCTLSLSHFWWQFQWFTC
jgi:hypothetical protein